MSPNFDAVNLSFLRPRHNALILSTLRQCLFAPTTLAWLELAMHICLLKGNFHLLKDRELVVQDTVVVSVLQ